MNRIKEALTIFTAMIAVSLNAQISIRTDYVNNIKFNNEDNIEGKGNISLTRASIAVPISKSVSADYKKIRSWNAFASFSYMKFNETTSSFYQTPEVLNVYTGASHFRTLNDRWSLLTYGGVGITTDTHKASELRWQNLSIFAMGNAIYKVNPNLNLGFGLIFTNVFDAPVVIPSFVVKWHCGDKYTLDLTSRTYDLHLVAGTKLNSAITLNYVADYDRIGAVTKLDGESRYKYYSYNYLTTGIRPVFQLSKRLKLPVEFGINATGEATYRKRSLSNILKTEDKTTFKTAPYCSVAIEYAL